MIWTQELLAHRGGPAQEDGGSQIVDGGGGVVAAVVAAPAAAVCLDVQGPQGEAGIFAAGIKGLGGIGSSAAIPRISSCIGSAAFLLLLRGR